MFLFIFDFDNTLGDAYGPYGEGNIFRTKTLTDVEKATEIYQKYRRWSDDILVYEKLLKELEIHHPEQFFINAGMPNQLFPDVIPFLTKLQTLPNVKTVILTAGDEIFHEMKVRITGASKLVNQVIVTRIRDKTEIIKRIIAHYEPESTIFVDDRIHMSPADFDTPITIYEMDRARKKEWEFVIHELDELPLDTLIDSTSRLAN